MRSFNDYQTFEAKVAVHRLEDTGVFLAEVAIRCVETGEVMQFNAANLFNGIAPGKACVSLGQFEITVPIIPPEPIFGPASKWPENWSWGQVWNDVCSDPNRNFADGKQED